MVSGSAADAASGPEREESEMGRQSSRAVRWGRPRGGVRALAVVVVLAMVAAALPSLGAAPAAHAQGGLAVDDLTEAHVTPVALAESLSGAGVTIDASSVTFTGDDRGGGSFSGGGGIVGVSGGLVLSSGLATDIVGPNNVDKSVPLNVPGDDDLEAIVGRSTYDASVLEFDFTVPGGEGTVYFQYVFGSEEYNRYVGSQWNDVFAFFVNGENCATVGEPPVEVSVNTINNGREAAVPPSNDELFINNNPRPPGDADGVVPEAELANTAMNGFTVPLECAASVHAGTNTMKLAIADTADRALDSWVLIEAGTLSVVPPGVDPPPPGDPDRVAGTDRVGTSIEISQTFESSEWVVVARSDDYADALAGAPLAAAYNAPILLTPRTHLAPEVAAEIQRLGATKGYMLGGEVALATNVQTALEGLDLSGFRLAGEDRFDTAGIIATRLPEPSGQAFIVEGQNPDPGRGWPDAVSVSALAAYTQTPILLTRQNAVPAKTYEALDALDFTGTTIVGGPAAVSAFVADEFAKETLTTPRRIFGANRYETSAAVANEARLAGMSPRVTWVATGRDFPDALAAAPIAGSTAPEIAANAGVLLLVDGHDASFTHPSVSWLRANATAIDRVRAVGGSAVITEATLTGLRAAAGAQ